jgi:hypothetical protein
MKIKKFTLTQEQSKLTYTKMPDETANDLYYPQEATFFKINLIELQRVNPSDLIFIIKQDELEIEMPLHLYKTEMIFLDNKYCWNTQEKEEFKIIKNRFGISVEGEKEEFSIDFYYSTDQKNPYKLFDRNRDSWHRY